MKLISLTTFYQLFRYGLTTVLSYVFLFSAMFLAVDIMKINQTLSYMIVLSITYIGVYISYTVFVFKKNSSPKQIARFISALIIIWIFNNSFFFILDYFFLLKYYLIVTINILLFGLIRFLIQKKWVFK